MSGGFDPAAFARLAEIEDGHYWFVARAELIRWILKHYANRPRDILEIGCGTGYMTRVLADTFPEGRIVASDRYAEAFPFARRRNPEAGFIPIDAREMAFDGAFDLVCAFDIIEHIDDDEEILRRVGVALRPGGCMVATVPQHPWLWSESDTLAHHARRYRTGELATKMERAGFQVTYRDSFVTSLLPLMALSRVLPKGGDLGKEFGVPAPVNAALLAVLRAEHAARRLGLRMPFGGSQVVVGRMPASWSRD